MIFHLVTVLLFLTLALLFWVVLRPDLHQRVLGRIAFGAPLVFGLALALGGPGGMGMFTLAQVPLALSLLLLIPAMTLTRGFARLDMVAILFHRDFGMKGASLKGLKNEIATTLAVVVLLWLASLRLDDHLKAGPALSTIVALGLVVSNPILRFAAKRLWVGHAPSVLPGRLAEPVLRSGPVARPDLVIVYLEGTDRRFADPQTFPVTAEKLGRFAARGLSLTGIAQTLGTGWSLAGMVATQSGVPVPPRGMKFRTGLDDLRSFMPGVTFLGDVLRDKGYRSHYIVGGESGFGGLGAMYASHGVTLTGERELRQMFPPEEVRAASVAWFLDDQMVLEAARRRHRSLAADPAPMTLIVETIAPHGPKGYLSRQSTKSGRAEETRDIGHAASCLLDEVSDFLTDIAVESARLGRDLRVVLLSDHLNHTPSLAAGRPGHAGFNTAIFLGDPCTPPRSIDRLGSMMDVFPTLLDWLGWCDAPVAAGLGRSLLSAPPTLVEEFGAPALDAMIAADARLAQILWDEGPSLAGPEDAGSPETVQGMRYCASKTAVQDSYPRRNGQIDHFGDRVS